jgi:hypothetical protein
MATTVVNPGQNAAGNGNSGGNNGGNSNNANNTNNANNANNTNANNNAAAGGNNSDNNTNNNVEDDKPLTASMLKALLGDFSKDIDTKVNKTVNGVKKALETRIEKLSTTQAAARAAAAEDDDNADNGNNATDNTGHGNNANTGNTAANGNTQNTNANANNNAQNSTSTSTPPALLKAQRQLSEALKRIELLESTNQQKDKETREARMSSAITLASGGITWATPKIKLLVENEARYKAKIDDNGVVTVDDMPVKDWMDAQYESDPGLRPAPVNAGGSGNNGGRTAARDWSKFNPSAVGVTQADRDGYREYLATLGRQRMGK